MAGWLAGARGVDGWTNAHKLIDRRGRISMSRINCQELCQACVKFRAQACGSGQRPELNHGRAVYPKALKSGMKLPEVAEKSVGCWEVLLGP